MPHVIEQTGKCLMVERTLTNAHILNNISSVVYTYTLLFFNFYFVQNVLIREWILAHNSVFQTWFYDNKRRKSYEETERILSFCFYYGLKRKIARAFEVVRGKEVLQTAYKAIYYSGRKKNIFRNVCLFFSNLYPSQLDSWSLAS